MLKTILKSIPGIMYLRKRYYSSKHDIAIAQKRRSFYSNFLKRGDTYFDIGANEGNRISPIIDMDLKIVAVEPQPSCVKFLSQQFGDQITIVPKGCGSKEEIKTMYISQTSIISTFSEDFIKSTKESGRFGDSSWDEKQEIQLTTLDNLIREFGEPQFIKIDVEGFELEVLKGLSAPVAMLSFEYTVPEKNDDMIECIKRLALISNDEILCNYSIGESMEWASDKWRTSSEMAKFVESVEFQNTRFGDIYVKLRGKS